jgi:uncharacterized protein YceK
MLKFNWKINVVLVFSVLLLLSGCGSKEIILQNQDGENINLTQQNKPTVLFFYTTYT